MHRSITLLDAPSNLGLRPAAPGAIPGVFRMPEVLRRRALLERLGAEEGGRVEPLPYSAEPELSTGYRNGPAMQRYSAALAERTRALIERGRFPLVLGGDCSILLGNMFALKQLGRYGLVFIDGHDDFSPARDPARYRGLISAAGQDLALVTGRGPDALTNLGGLRPYVAEREVVLFGLSREPTDDRDFDMSLLDRTEMEQWRIERIRAAGVRAAAEQTRKKMESLEIEGFWIHVDADVLDRTVMPAVDSPNPAGLTFAELAETLRILLESPKAVGLELTIYDPDLDPSGACADQLADLLVEVLGPRPDSGLQAALGARGPLPELEEELELYGQFVGDWTFDVVDHREDGSALHRHGEWRFGWILDGRAIQDVWMVPGPEERARSGAPLTGYGTTLRIFDPKLDAWRITWIGGLSGTVQTFIARLQNGEIVQEGQHPENGKPLRWIFSEMRPASFRWRSEFSDDGGSSWRLEQEMRVRRRPTSP